MAFRLIDKEKYAEGFCQEILEEAFCELEKNDLKVSNKVKTKKENQQSENKRNHKI